MKYNFNIDKKVTFIKDIYLLNEGIAETLVGKTIRCVIKESHETEEVLFDLTEANGGIVVLDDPTGKIRLYISADDLDIEADFGVYTIVSIDDVQPTELVEKILDGKITFIKGTL